MLRRLIGEHIDDRRRSSMPSCRRVMADRGQLEQIVVNLAVNARDAMPSGGTLTIDDERAISTRATRRAATARRAVRRCSTVTDTGIGMDAATRPRMFEPFFTTKEPGEGTGLGLATVYGIVQQIGGDIEVESELRPRHDVPPVLSRSARGRERGCRAYDSRAGRPAPRGARRCCSSRTTMRCACSWPRYSSGTGTTS